MKSIGIIALNTYREIIRDRILYGILVFAILLIGLSMALGQLSFAEQARITASFGMTGIQIGAAIVSIFLGSTLVTKEIEKKTIMTLLVRPVSRTQFLLGKSLGLIFVQVTVMGILMSVLLGIFKFMGVLIEPQAFVAIYGIFLESLVLLGVTLFFSIFATSMMVVAFALGVFLIGHWIDSLNYFVKKGQSEWIKEATQFILKATPNLERFNWRNLMIYSDPISSKMLIQASLYAMVWFVFLVALAGFIFRRRDFV
ncbi:MAG: ABC transporter permease [Bdellovibrionales bacterium]|nr:ABC transporter permease [Bdellovibrionales bacterium]